MDRAIAARWGEGDDAGAPDVRAVCHTLLVVNGPQDAPVHRLEAVVSTYRSGAGEPAKGDVVRGDQVGLVARGPRVST